MHDGRETVYRKVKVGRNIENTYPKTRIVLECPETSLSELTSRAGVLLPLLCTSDQPRQDSTFWLFYKLLLKWRDQLRTFKIPAAVSHLFYLACLLRLLQDPGSRRGQWVPPHCERMWVSFSQNYKGRGEDSGKQSLHYQWKGLQSGQLDAQIESVTLLY